MKQNAAFTLLELVVYSALFSILVLLVTSFCTFVFVSVRQSHDRATMTTKNVLALDAVRRDLMSACFEKAYWDAGNGIFVKEYIDRRGQSKKQCVGWDCTMLANEKPALRRSVGVYDFKQHRWTKRTASTIGCWLRNLTMQLEADTKTNAVLRVQLSYFDQSLNAPMTDVVALRNRVLS